MQLQIHRRRNQYHGTREFNHSHTTDIRDVGSTFMCVRSVACKSTKSGITGSHTHSACIHVVKQQEGNSADCFGLLSPRAPARYDPIESPGNRQVPSCLTRPGEGEIESPLERNMYRYIEKERKKERERERTLHCTLPGPSQSHFHVKPNCCQSSQNRECVPLRDLKGAKPAANLKLKYSNT